MPRLLVLNIVGLTPALIGPHTPALAALRERSRLASLSPSLPAVTAAVQATMLTGTSPQDHGIVGNGWFDRENAEVRFWRQADALVRRPRVWELLRRHDPTATTANCFWWNAMYASADVTLTPRPMYPADGRKLPDVWTHPPALRQQMQSTLGQFPLFKFWGPMTDVSSTRWIASAALEVERRFRPTLNLVYLPHLDYVLQRDGPDAPGVPQHLREVDAEAGRLISAAESAGVRVLVVSEYGITPVDTPVHLNRVLREHGYLTLRDELGRELLDAAASRAFAVADHQLAHVYVRDDADRPAVRTLLERTPGVDRVYAGRDRQAIGLDHDRAGDFVVLSRPRAWFTYYYWLEDARAPDFARTVDIHRKPGYDPAELFLDPALKWPKARIAARLIARRLGQRNLLDVIPLDAAIVRGSHGLPPVDAASGPVLMSNTPDLLDKETYAATEVAGVILKHVGFA